MTPIAQKIEALLFLAGEPLAKKELATFLGKSEEAIQQACQEIAQTLAQQGINLVQTDTHAELDTSASVAAVVQAWLPADKPELSKASAETLAIIAYRGPLARYDVDVIRGVDSRHSLRQLLRRGLIRRREEKTTTPRYEITAEFLRHLGLTNRTQLPQFTELSSHEKLNQLLTQQETNI